MKCKNNHEIYAPLVKYDGTWYCPICRKQLVDQDIDFKVTKKGDEYFQLALLNYYLSFEQLEKTRNDLISVCVENTRKAIKEGHPCAYVLMGYLFDKDYTGLHQSKIERCQIAFQYYSVVFSSSLKDSDFKVDDSISNRPNFGLIKKQAASLLSKMLALVEDDAYLRDKFYFNANLELLKKKYNIDINEIKRQYVERLSQSDKLLRLLLDCKNPHRAPVFSVFHDININSLKELSGKDNENQLNTLLKKENIIGTFFLKQDKVYDKPISFKDYRTLLEEIDLIDKGNYSKIDLFIFNENEGVKIKRKDLKLLRSLLENSEDENLDRYTMRRIVEKTRSNDLMFYKEDLLIFDKGKKLNKFVDLKESLDELISDL